MHTAPADTAGAAAPRIERIDLANPGHCTALLELLDHYARDPMGGGTALSEATLAGLIPGLAACPGYVGFLARDDADDSAIGLINCFMGFSTFAAKPLLNVHDIVVLRARRAQGVGQALLAAAEAEARARGCCKLTLEVLSNNQRALASYARFGFQPYVLDPAAGHAQLLQRWL